MVWTREMYGLQIKNLLKRLGEDVSPGQLYPALDKLNKMKLLKVREEIKKGANRKYYRITEKGKGLMYRNFISLFALVELTAIEKFSFIFDEVLKMVPINAGSIVVDFTNPVINQGRIKFAPLTAPTGRYFAVNTAKFAKDLLSLWLVDEGLQDIVSILKPENESISLPDQSVDVILVFFQLHEDKTEWIIKETKRILKPDGKALIIDVEDLKGHIIEQVLVAFMPDHSRMGINKEIFYPLLKNNQLDVVFEKKKQGYIYFILQPRT
jgi:DNA-binding PadR family transcriptional regulator